MTAVDAGLSEIEGGRGSRRAHVRTSEYGSYVTGARTPEDADAASPHATHR